MARSCARIVQPRKRSTNANREIYAVNVTSNECLTSNGELLTLGTLTDKLPGITPAIFTCVGGAELTAIFHDRYRHDPAWQFKATPAQRQQFRPRRDQRGYRKFINLTIVDFFGWHEPGHRRNRYHLVLDPVVFADGQYKSRTLPELMEWAIQIRDFCVSEQINLRPTQGAMARQFLRDPRFYPEARRKVPRATNDKLRDHIGTNHYETRTRTGKHYQGIYLDQSSAHHFHARNTQLPDANSLYAYGSFRKGRKPWKRNPERVQRFLRSFHGAILADVAWKPRGGVFVPTALDQWKPGRPVVIFTNELDLYRSIGVRIKAIYAAWGSTKVDTGLGKYATHAQSLIANNPPGWLKPLLLSAYGCLATRPKCYTVGFAKAKRGEPHDLLAGKRVLPALLVETTKETEPGTNNVLHRGMIEAATRAESLMFANYLQSRGVRVLAIYVDAVIVEDDADTKDQILILSPWREKQGLSSLQFLAPNAFVSVELTKLPGTPSRELMLGASNGRTPAGRIGDQDRQIERRIEAWERSQGLQGP